MPEIKIQGDNLVLKSTMTPKEAAELIESLADKDFKIVITIEPEEKSDG